MANELMTKVKELLELGGVNDDTVKAVTEKLISEKVELKPESEVVAEQEKEAEEEAKEAEEKVEEAEEKVEEAEVSEEAGLEVKHEEEDDEDQKEAPVDKNINVGGYDAVKEDLDNLKVAYAQLIAERILDEAEADEVEESGEEEVAESEEITEEEALVEALSIVLEAVKEANARSQQIMRDYEVLKEEFAKIVASQVIAEAEDEEEAEESDDAEKDNAEEKEDAAKASKDDEKAKEDEEKGDKKDAEDEVEKGNEEMGKVKNLMHDEKKDFDKAHCDKCESLDEETADKISEEVTEISEEVVAEAPVKKLRKAYSAFETISESVEEKVEVAKPARKAYTAFPEL